MKNEPDFFQIALSFFAVIGFILLIRMFFIWFFKLKEDTKILSSPIKVMDDFEEEFLLKGYIFCTLFKVTDIIIIARKMNIALTMDQVRLVIISVRKDFDINTGIDAHRISMHIRMVVKQQLARQKPV